MPEYTSNSKRFCSVFKSPKKQEMYLYVDRKTDTNDLPEALLALFGEPGHVLDMVLTPDKKLARVDAQRVLDDIADKGFYLQMPPGKEDYLLDLYPAPKDSLHG